MKYEVSMVLYGITFKSEPCTDVVSDILLRKFEDFQIAAYKHELVLPVAAAEAGGEGQ